MCSMRIVVVFESMFGNTARVAEEIAFRLGPRHELELFDVNASSAAGDSRLSPGARAQVHERALSLESGLSTRADTVTTW